MSIDILRYTANKEITWLCTNEAGLRTTITSNYACVDQNTATCLMCWRAMESDIKVNPELSNVICVTDTSYYTMGSCCAWTVPTNVYKARFEIWGPGSAGGGGTCCGGGPWGTNGAFMAFTIPVTPGCVYTLCAACSNVSVPFCNGCLTYAQNCCFGNAKCSFVSGYGLSGITVPGGCYDLVQNMCARLCRIGCSIAAGTGAPCPTRFINECCYVASPNNCGLTICNCYTLCNSGSQPTYAMTPVADWTLWPTGNVTVGLCNYTPIYKIPAIHNGVFINTSNYGFYNFIPPYPKCGWTVNNCFNLGCYTGGGSNLIDPQVTSGTCCGYNNYSTCCLCISMPGLGGGYSHAMGGSISVYGDYGRNGMVKVIWQCGSAGSTNYACAN